MDIWPKKKTSISVFVSLILGLKMHQPRGLLVLWSPHFPAPLKDWGKWALLWLWLNEEIALMAAKYNNCFHVYSLRLKGGTGDRHGCSLWTEGRETARERGSEIWLNCHLSEEFSSAWQCCLLRTEAFGCVDGVPENAPAVPLCPLPHPPLGALKAAHIVPALKSTLHYNLKMERLFSLS